MIRVWFLNESLTLTPEIITRLLTITCWTCPQKSKKTLIFILRKLVLYFYVHVRGEFRYRKNFFDSLILKIYNSNM